MADVTVGIVLSSGPDLYREAIDCVLDQDGVQVEVVVVGKSNRYSFESRPEPRVKFLDVPNLPTQAELLRLLAARGNAPFVMSLKAHEHLLPNALVTLVTRMHASEKIDMAYALPFPADKDGNISSFAYHDQWERAHKLRKFEPSNLKDYLTVDFLLHGIKLYRRHSLASKVFSVQETYSDYALVWAPLFSSSAKTLKI